jgi:hypothetical protein
LGFFFECHWGITPHLNIYSKKPQNGSLKIYKRFKEENNNTGYPSARVLRRGTTTDKTLTRAETTTPRHKSSSTMPPGR